MPALEPFLRHPREQGETYLEHASVAGSVGGRMVVGGLACLVHAVAPFLFTTTGSRTITSLSDDLRSRRRAGTVRAPARAATSREAAMADFGAGI